MFKIFLFLFISTSMLVTMAQAQNVQFSGMADRKYDGNKIVLYNRTTGDHDSAVIKQGRFALEVRFKEPTMYMFYSQLELKNKGGYAPYGILVSEPGTIRIQADVENFTGSKVSGSKENDLYRSLAEKGASMQKKIMDELYAKYGKEFVMNRNPDTTGARYKELLQDYYRFNKDAQSQQLNRLEQLIKEHPASFAAVYLLNSYATMLDLPKLENLYASLASDYRDSRTGKSVASVIEAGKITAIGKIAPDFTQPDTAAKAVTLSSLRGKYVLVDFWASWCGPCRAENPNLVQTFSKYKDKGFTVLGVSLDQTGKKDAWLAAIHKDKLNWTQVSGLRFWDNEAAVLYGIKSIPSNVLLDPEGRIVAKNLRGVELSKKLSEILADKERDQPLIWLNIASGAATN